MRIAVPRQLNLSLLYTVIKEIKKSVSSLLFKNLARKVPTLDISPKS